MKTTKFKMTEIGPIPEDWDVKQFSECFTLIRNNTYARESLTDSIGSVANIHYGDVLIKYGAVLNFMRDSVPYLKSGVMPNRDMLKNGDLVFADTAEDEAVGKAVEVQGVQSRMVVAGLHTVACRPREGMFAPRYLGYYINSPAYHNQLLSLITGTKVSSVSRAGFLSTYVVRPPLHEQKAIAEALSDVDELLAAMTTLIEKKRAIKQGAMQELLTGKKRLPGFGGKWIEKRLGDCALIKARIGWQGLTTDEYLENGPYYLITGSDFRDGKVNWSQCYYVDKSRYEQDKNIQIQKNDVLVSKDGTIGKVAFLDEIPGEGTLNSGVFVIRTRDKEIEQLYMAWVFLSKWFDDFINRLVAGSTIVHLYQKDIVGFEFPVPPTIAEQKAIADVLSDMDAEITALETKKTKYESIKQSMMQELLTGKTRLV